MTTTYPRVVKAVHSVTPAKPGVTALKEGETYTAVREERHGNKSYLVLPHKNSEILWGKEHFETKLS